LSLLERVYEQRSSDRHTVKWLFRLGDGLTIETVLMLYDERRTVCISTQAGCAMGCVFCATGQAGLARNLTQGEIVAQVLYAARYLANTPAEEPATASAFIPLSAFGSLGSALQYSPEFPGEERGAQLAARDCG
jgi:23S rRNA (adenine2503-C2)-methyltransferase